MVVNAPQPVGFHRVLSLFRQLPNRLFDNLLQRESIQHRPKIRAGSESYEEWIPMAIRLSLRSETCHGVGLPNSWHTVRRNHRCQSINPLGSLINQICRGIGASTPSSSDRSQRNAVTRPTQCHSSPDQHGSTGKNGYRSSVPRDSLGCSTGVEAMHRRTLQPRRSTPQR